MLPRGAPDGGYGWVVLAASFCAHFFIYGVAWSVGVFYQIFIEHFDESSASIALITSMLTATTYGSGTFSISVLHIQTPCHRHFWASRHSIGDTKLKFCRFFLINYNIFKLLQKKAKFYTVYPLCKNHTCLKT